MPVSWLFDMAIQLAIQLAIKNSYSVVLVILESCKSDALVIQTLSKLFNAQQLSVPANSSMVCEITIW
ncbi:uncharacterized protein ASCRUDRAFT_78366 [Ascoidea rubescens DSM 1968]|uniref:Uncharacterized protein n=1 Tax=Ascoidea rubescens DSM 1968 TaxID=1344418 RepID=A0A1D2V850_9ASCO|nr:hypothetical protein ASCRUDRAFT_78361 [Ascoidea rubescens DSM 1968]XP_020044133.1 hypothetical protein ASCRUDRAFT_78366 [Ascoidea rubescens DSM 1968]ODV57821.1 hypothetical protein ASCRUDRAFT_78361 [Ascoidea rubescens DSM 1968]ODV57826.1 hypothetical protein ASCRUDRAFT_78366 [Ascoidea rubescens DSM 1968]